QRADRSADATRQRPVPLCRGGGRGACRNAAHGPEKPRLTVSDDHRACCGQDFERLFDEREAARDLRAWEEDGLPDSTAELVDSLLAEGVEGAMVLDVGAGIGMVHIELLTAGAASAVDVDLSRAYLAVARQEAERRGLLDRI